MPDTQSSSLPMQCGLHERMLRELHGDVRTMLEKLQNFATVVAVQTTEMHQTRKDIDALWTQVRDSEQKNGQRLESIETDIDEIKGLIKQLEGARKAIIALWAVFGGAILALGYAVLKHVISIN